MSDKFKNTVLADALRVEMLAGNVKPAELPTNAAPRGFRRLSKPVQIEPATNAAFDPFPAETPSDAEIAELAKTPAVIETETGQRLVNRRRVAKPDYLRNGVALDLTWVRGQVAALRERKTPMRKIVAALDRVGVRRGDGTPITVADVERWAVG